MGNFKVVITDREYQDIDNELRILKEINAEVYDYQIKDEDEIIKVANDCDAIIIQYAKLNERIINSLKNCKIIAKYATGLDGIDIEAATKKGIMVSNVQNYCSDEVSTHALSLLLSMNRRLCDFHKWTTDGNWFNLGKEIMGLRTSIIGIIGFGKISRLLINKLKPLCDEIWVYSNSASTEEVEKLGAKHKSFEEVIENADYISIHCPGNLKNKHLFNKEVFKKMKKRSVIINVARGSVVNEDDLIWALNEKEIAGAALDVLEQEPPNKDNPLLRMENVIITPHTGWYSADSQRRLQSTVAEDVARVLTGNIPENLVNEEVLKNK